MARNSSTSRGSRTTTIHAPSTNFVVATTSSTTNVASAPTPLNTMLRCQPVASKRELVGQELVAAQEVRQAREVRVGRVRRQEQNQECRVLDRVVQRRIAKHAAGDLGHDGLGFAPSL